ncbi:hypothetical protein DXA36_12705 [Eisenbergiella sp. OF01-20]|nr:hypothetical protein DXA36_12705 [Eisenbergiella sp. OF01-20]
MFTGQKSGLIESFNGDKTGSPTGRNTACSGLRFQSYLPHTIPPGVLSACGTPSLPGVYAYSSFSSSFADIS